VLLLYGISRYRLWFKNPKNYPDLFLIRTYTIINKKNFKIYFSSTPVKITSPERTSPTTKISGDRGADGVNDGAGATGVVSLGEVSVRT
jgi:hypothetical protein